jgi:hypothetical protein
MNLSILSSYHPLHYIKAKAKALLLILFLKKSKKSIPRSGFVQRLTED